MAAKGSLANSIKKYGLDPKDWRISSLQIKDQNTLNVEFTHKQDQHFRIKGLAEILQGSPSIKRMHLVSL